MESRKISVEKSMTRDQAAEYLADLACLFKTGRVDIEYDGRGLGLILPAALDVEIEAKAKKGKAKLCLEFSWREAVPEERPVDLNIKAETGPEGVETKAGDLDLALKAARATAEAAKKAVGFAPSASGKAASKKPAAKAKKSPAGKGNQKA